MKVKLAEGRRLRDPVTHAHLEPDQVREVPRNTYWVRRLRDGDVVEVNEHGHHQEQRRQPAQTAQPHPLPHHDAQRPTRERGE